MCTRVRKNIETEGEAVREVLCTDMEHKRLVLNLSADDWKGESSGEAGGQVACTEYGPSPLTQ